MHSRRAWRLMVTAEWATWLKNRSKEPRYWVEIFPDDKNGHQVCGGKITDLQGNVNQNSKRCLLMPVRVAVTKTRDKCWVTTETINIVGGCQGPASAWVQALRRGRGIATRKTSDHQVGYTQVALNSSGHLYFYLNWVSLTRVTWIALLLVASFDFKHITI